VQSSPLNATPPGGSSSGPAWARSRTSSIITDAIVMAIRQLLALSGASCSVALRTWSSMPSI